MFSNSEDLRYALSKGYIIKILYLLGTQIFVADIEKDHNKKNFVRF